MQVSLSPQERTLVDAAVSHLLSGYNPQTGLVTEVMEGAPYRSVRNSMYLALGLLIQEGSAQLPTALKICEAVLDLQLLNPEEIWHGTFRHPDDPPPPVCPVPFRDLTPRARYMADVAWEKITDRFSADLQENPALRDLAPEVLSQLRRSLLRTVPVAWDTYEPNLREFIGMTFAMLLEHFDTLLPEDMLRKLEASVRALMDGAVSRVKKSLTPLNTNIRIMYVFLADYFGTRFQEPAWKAEALREGRELEKEYLSLHACAEFNSPTYCGVDLSTLGFFRRYSRNEELVRIMNSLEEGIWRDMADFYNPDMRAFCGPYSRCYELDMSVHTCFYDLLYLTLGEDLFPWHPFSIESVIAPLTVLGSYKMPEDVKPRFLSPCRERQVTRSFRELSERGDPDNNQALCTAHAFISPDFMLGGMSGSRNTSYQLHTLVAFWRTNQGIGTLKLLRCLEDGEMCHLHYVDIDAQTEDRSAHVRAVSHVGRPVLLFLEFECPGLNSDAFAGDVWHLPGLDLSLRTSLPLTVKPAGEKVYRVYFRLERDVPADLALSFTPVQGT